MIWVRASRAYSLTAVLMPCVAIAILGWTRHAAFHPLIALTAALGVSAMLLGVNFANDVEDDTRGIDSLGSLGGSGVLQAGLLSRPQMRVAAVILIGAGVVLGVPTVLAAPQAMLVVGAIALAGSVAYSHHAVGLKYHALGDTAVFVMCGPLLAFGASIAAFGVALPSTIALGAVFGFAAVAILHANNLQDIEVDTAHGARTVATVIGARASRAYFVALYLAAVAAWCSAGLGARVTCFGALGFIPALALAWRVARAGDLHMPAFSLLRMHAARAHLAIGVSVCAALIVFHH